MNTLEPLQSENQVASVLALKASMELSEVRTSTKPSLHFASPRSYFDDIPHWGNSLEDLLQWWEDNLIQ